jgi:hypothetical protein
MYKYSVNAISSLFDLSRNTGKCILNSRFQCSAMLYYSILQCSDISQILSTAYTRLSMIDTVLWKWDLCLSRLCGGMSHTRVDSVFGFVRGVARQRGGSCNKANKNTERINHCRKVC